MTDQGVVRASELFKALSSPSRLAILLLLAKSPTTVGGLVTATGQSQPLVSQHLKNLRAANVVTVERLGREATYSLADRHIAHVIEDAVSHSMEVPG